MPGHTRFEKLVTEAKKNIREISPQDAAAKSQSDEAVIIDVREKDEWDEEHIPNATHLSWHDQVGHRRKNSRHKCYDRLPLRRRLPIRACGRKPAKNGLQKRLLHGRRLQSLESRWVADGEMTEKCKRVDVFPFAPFSIPPARG
jgi:hypothetical protein